MPLSAEERAKIIQGIPNFDSDERAQYLAERKLLPQQQKDMESFADPPLLTSMRRALFGYTNAEQALVKRQKEALLPFQQEQQVKAMLAPLLQTNLSELMSSPMGQQIRPTPEQRQLVPSGSMTVPQHLVPDTFDIDKLMQRNVVGMTPSNIAFGQPGSQVATPITEPVMPAERSLPTYAPGNELIPGVKPTMLQALQAHSMLDPSVMAANLRTTGQAQSPIGKLVADLQASPPGSEGQSTIRRAIEDQMTPESLQLFQGTLAGAGIDPQSEQGRKLFASYAEKISTHPNATTVNVNTLDTASAEAQKKFMDSARGTYDQLKTAPTLLANIERAKALIPGARGFMGTGGETLLEATKFLNNRLGLKIATEGIKNAEELRSRIFFNIMDNLKKMDAQPSQMQQQIMMESLGKLGTDPNALGNVLDAYADTVRGKVDTYNTEVTGAETRGVKFPYKPQIVLPKVPEGAAPPPPGTPVAPFHDAEKEKRYQEFKRQHR